MLLNVVEIDINSAVYAPRPQQGPKFPSSLT